jgi:hypothetical protein
LLTAQISRFHPVVLSAAPAIELEVNANFVTHVSPLCSNDVCWIAAGVKGFFHQRKAVFSWSMMYSFTPAERHRSADAAVRPCADRSVSGRAAA